MIDKAKFSLIILLAAVILVSCSPPKVRFEESEQYSAEPVSTVTRENVHGPTEVYELSALDEDFLQQSVLLPYYENITSEQLEYNFLHGAQSYKGVSARVNAILPDSVLCAHGNFIYDKRTGRISRSCTDPQCRHLSHEIQLVFAACPYTQIGMCRICGDTVYMCYNNPGVEEIKTPVLALDRTFREHFYPDLPKGCNVEGTAGDGRLILNRERYVGYIDDNGWQIPQGEFELYLYDPVTGESELVFAPGSIYFVTCSKSCAYCTMYPENTVYAFTGDFRQPVNLGKIKMLAFLDGAMCYYDKESGAAYRFDETTGEKTLWANEDSALARISYSVYCGDKLYFTRYHTAEEIYAMDLIPEDQKNGIAESAEQFAPSIIYRCDPDGSDIETVYYVPGYRLNGFSVDGEVIYTEGVFENKGGYFAAYDMSSGVELRVYCPIQEYHYPGEYEYNENWLRAFRW